jgi:hypothetical protein
LALLVDHAAWVLVHGSDPRPAAAARRIAHSGVDLIGTGVPDDGDAALLARDAFARADASLSSEPASSTPHRDAAVASRSRVRAWSDRFARFALQSVPPWRRSP